MRAMTAAALLWASFASAHAQSEPPARIDVVDRSIEYHGGERYAKSRSRLQLCSASGCYQLDVRVDGGLYRYEVEGDVRGASRRVVVTNDSVEMWIDGKSSEIPAERVDSVRDWAMARIYFCFLPYRLNDASVFKQDLGIEIWEDRRLQKVKVTFAPGSSSGADDEYLYWFDPGSGRLEQLAYSFSGNPGGLRFRKATRYRRIGDILFFDQENFGVAGDQLSVDRVTQEFVEQMKSVSTIELSDIKVEALD